VPGRIVTAATKTVTYFDSTFDEAMALTREARDYLAYQEKAPCA
jgi:GH25 family lysozyme M1 (1,4-beta-N-acetylmuramidase)